MIKINDILTLVNSSLETHYFKDITTYGITQLVGQEGEDIKRPAIYKGRGNYEFIQEDTKGLIIYHRITSFDNSEDREKGFGRNAETTETYEIKSVFYGQQVAIEDDNCEDINLYLAKEFKKLVPRSLDLVDITSLIVTGIEYDRETLKDEEGIEYVPESVFFALTLEVEIIGVEECNTVSCEVEPWQQCDDVTVVDCNGNNTVASGSTYTVNSRNISNSDDTYDVTLTACSLELPDVDNVDSDGTTVPTPAQTPFVCTPATPQSGIQYNRDYFTLQTTIYTTYDDGWQVANAGYAFTDPANPATIQKLDLSGDATGMTLVSNNSFGNKIRFTDAAGLAVVAIDGQYIIDNWTGLAYWDAGISVSYNNALGIGGTLETFNTAGTGGFSDFFVTNWKQMVHISTFEPSVPFILPYMASIAGAAFIVSTTRTSSTTNTYRFRANGDFITIAKSSTQRVVYCRVHF